MAGFEPDLSSYAGYQNTNKLLATATNTPENANAWAQNRLLNTAAQSSQLRLSQEKLGALNNIVSSVMADPTAENAQARIADGVRMGVLTPEQATQTYGELASLGGDPAKIKQWAFQHGQPLIDAMQRMQISGMGAPELVSNGQQLTPIVRQGGLNPGIAPAAGAPIQLEQSPGELAAPRTYTDGSGVTHQTTQRGYQQAVGDPATVDLKRASSAKVVNGKIVYGDQPAAGGAPAAMPGLAGPAPGVTGAADTTAQAGAQMGNALTAAADKATDRRATLSNLQAQLQNIATGPNAETWNTIKAGANAALDIAGAPESVRFDRQKIASAEEFRKNAQILANQQQQALGGTDAALAAAGHSNPSLDLSTLGNRQILATLQGNEDAIQVKNAEWQKWLQAGNSPGSYPQFAAQFNKTFSPRAFQFAHMTPGERAELVKTMNPQDRAALAGALKAARDNGWINPGG